MEERADDTCKGTAERGDLRSGTTKALPPPSEECSQDSGVNSEGAGDPTGKANAAGWSRSAQTSGRTHVRLESFLETTGTSNTCGEKV